SPRPQRPLASRPLVSRVLVSRLLVSRPAASNLARHMTAPRSTGMPGVDAQHDFLRARRRASYSKLLARLRWGPDDVDVILPYEEVVQALGFVSERSVGLKVVQ